MLPDAARSLWAEPRVAGPPPRGWPDWALVVGLVPVALLEGTLAEGLVWPAVSVVVALALLPTLLFRRSHPLAALVAAFAALTAVDVVSLLARVHWEGLGTNVFVLLLLYSVFRWGSGRSAALGLVVVSVPLLLSTFDEQIHPGTERMPAGDVAMGGLVLLVTAAVGAAVRYRDNARARGMDQVKLLEREQLARELHDTVAHHVSAIAIRAQAGRVVAAADPEAALDALLLIEAEASRTLAEMRAMVGALRQGDEAQLAPQPGVADIERLRTRPGQEPAVAVELSGDLAGLRPSVDAALYRLAQEAITNAVRHARHATRILVAVDGGVDSVRLTVGDDGEPLSFDPRTSSGFGLIGMAERAKLLGGTLEAGPAGHRGWTVDAVLPRTAGPS